MPANNYKWTAIFLMYAVKEYADDAIRAINKLASLNTKGEVGIMICLSVETAALDASKLPRGTVRSRRNHTTVFYSVESKGDYSDLSLITEEPDFDIREDDFIVDVFRNKVLSLFSADHYILFTWDHGQPFGIFASDSPGASLTGAIELSKAKYNPLITHFTMWADYKKDIRNFSGRTDVIADPASSGVDERILTISELRVAIEKAFGNQKIDVIAMYNCFLNFFDTGYELCENVEYLVAFETLMSFDDSLEYHTILKFLIENPTTASTDVAKLCVSSFASSSATPSARRNQVALFANDLSWYPPLAKYIDELADMLIRELPYYYDKINRAVQSCRYVNVIDARQFCLVDLRNFVKRLYAEIAFDPVLYANLINTMDKIVVAGFVGSDLNRHPTTASYPSGFSIYLPKDVYDYKTDFLSSFMFQASPLATSYARKFKWMYFVRKFVYYPN